MATATRGCLGKIKVQDLDSASAVAVMGGVQEWSVTEEAEQINASEIGTCDTKFVAGSITRTATISGFWDEDDSGQDTAILAIGNIIDLEVFPEGDSTGDARYYTGSDGATITNYELSGGNDSLVSFSLTVQINGTWTKGTAS